MRIAHWILFATTKETEEDEDGQQPLNVVDPQRKWTSVFSRGSGFISGTRIPQSAKDYLHYPSAGAASHWQTCLIVVGSGSRGSGKEIAPLQYSLIVITCLSSTMTSEFWKGTIFLWWFSASATPTSRFNSNSRDLILVRSTNCTSAEQWEIAIIPNSREIETMQGCRQIRKNHG